MKTSGLAAAAQPAIYVSYSRFDAITDAGLLVRSPLDVGVLANEIRRTVLGIDADQPVSKVESLDTRLTESVSTPRFTAALLCAFAGLAAISGSLESTELCHAESAGRCVRWRSGRRWARSHVM